MEEQNHDWLDKRLAASSYVPDDGFTASVMQRVPKARVAPAQRRTTILVLTGTAAAVLLALHLPMAIEAMNTTVNHAIAPSVPTLHNVWVNLSHDLQQPAFRYGTAGALSLLTLASIPFLRRWA